MTLPRICRYKPFYVELSKGKPYLWCSCGLSQNQPYCDGSHKDTDFKPVLYRATDEREEVLFCACKHTKDAPFCDGTHNNLLDEYETDDPNSDRNRSIPVISRGSDGLSRLDGDCYVASVNDLPINQHDGIQIATVISTDAGALYQSQYLITIEGDVSPILSFGDHDVLIFIAEGHAQLNISGVNFEAGRLSGAYVQPNEAFLLQRTSEEPVRAYVSVCLSAASPQTIVEMPTNFDDSNPQRVVPFDMDNRVNMADRFFQVLVGKETGCDRATQFIGEIPFSKAAVHRHLYEESLIIVSGEGVMWTDDRKAPVYPGDVIFLPRKEAHSLQCVSPEGMLVAGVIYPGDNPSINY